MESYISNISSVDVPYQSIPKRLKFLATKYQDKTAFVFVSAIDDTRICMSFGELFEKSESFAKGLKSFGFGREDVIGVGDERSPETLVAIFGVQMIGAIPLIFRFSRKDGQNVVDTGNYANYSALIVDLGDMDENLSILEKIVERTNEDGTVVSSCLPSLQKLIFMRTPNSNIDGLTLQRVMDCGTSSSESLPDIDPESIAALFLTSGSTGIPKLTTYTHYSILMNGYYFAVTYGVIGNDKSIVYNDRPFSWGVGFPSLVIITGGCRIVVRNTSTVKYVPEMNKLTSRIIKSEKCTCAVLITPFLHEMLASESCELLVDTIVTTGQPVFSSLSRCVGKLCNNFVVMYGMTEVGPVTFKHVNKENSVFKAFSIGQPLPGVELKILNKDGRMVPRGDSGEIYVRSPLRFTGYFNRDVETRKSLSKYGWFKTDDLGHISDNGDVIMEGRASEAILIYGKLVLPSHLESDIKSHPGVHDVVVSAVPDAEAFQHACASIILKPGFFSLSGEDINAFIYDMRKSNEQLAFGTMLKYFPKHYIFCDHFQLTYSGKTDRKSVTKHAIDTLKEMKAI